MRVRYAGSTVPVHALKVGDRVQERSTGEVREVSAIDRTLTEARITLDDGSFFDAGILDTAYIAPTSHDSENADDPLAGNPYDLDADELAPNGRRDETPIDAEEPIESVFRT